AALCRKAGRDEGIVDSDRTKGCCYWPELKSAPHHDQFAELDAHRLEELPGCLKMTVLFPLGASHWKTHRRWSYVSTDARLKRGARRSMPFESAARWCDSGRLS